MKENKTIKIVLLFVIIIVAIMGYFIYSINNEKINAENEVANLNNKVDSLKNTNEDLQGKIDYLANFSKSVSEELGNANTIIAEDFLNGQLGISYAEVNSKSETYIYFKADSDLHKKYGNNYKIADDVANVYIYGIGQADNEYIFLLKKDGTVSYIEIDDSNNGNLEIKNLSNVKDITNIIQIQGNVSEGIGGYGVLFITSDGSCLPYFHL